MEDEPLIGLDLVVTLQDAGYEVAGPAPDLTTALREADRFRPHAAFVDVNLDDGPTGPEVARALYSDYGTRSVFLTGNPELTRTGAAEGLLRKPYRASSLLETAGWLSAGATGDRPADLEPASTTDHGADKR